MGPGWLPRYRPRGLRRSALAYRRTRKRSRVLANATASARAWVDTEIVSFDHGPAEFPMARVQPHDTGARVTAALGAIQRWFADRWQWLRPRTLPCAVAGLGMFAVLAFSDYLAHYEDESVQASPPAVHIDLAPR